MYTHRYIMEQYLGRKLKYNEQVHHKDGDRKNNDIFNLELVTIQEHTRLHHLGTGHKPIVLICDYCSKKFERIWSQRPKIKHYKKCYCSRYCMGKDTLGRKHSTTR